MKSREEGDTALVVIQHLAVNRGIEAVWCARPKVVELKVHFPCLC